MEVYKSWVVLNNALYSYCPKQTTISYNDEIARKQLKCQKVRCVEYISSQVSIKSETRTFRNIVVKDFCR